MKIIENGNGVCCSIWINCSFNKSAFETHKNEKMVNPEEKSQQISLHSNAMVPTYSKCMFESNLG